MILKAKTSQKQTEHRTEKGGIILKSAEKVQVQVSSRQWSFRTINGEKSSSLKW